MTERTEGIGWGQRGGVRVAQIGEHPVEFPKVEPEAEPSFKLDLNDWPCCCWGCNHRHAPGKACPRCGCLA